MDTVQEQEARKSPSDNSTESFEQLVDTKEDDLLTSAIDLLEPEPIMNANPPTNLDLLTEETGEGLPLNMQLSMTASDHSTPEAAKPNVVEDVPDITELKKEDVSSTTLDGANEPGGGDAIVPTSPIVADVSAEVDSFYEFGNRYTSQEKPQTPDVAKQVIQEEDDIMREESDDDFEAAEKAVSQMTQSALESSLLPSVNVTKEVQRPETPLENVQVVEELLDEADEVEEEEVQEEKVEKISQPVIESPPVNVHVQKLSQDAVVESTPPADHGSILSGSIQEPQDNEDSQDNKNHQEPDLRIEPALFNPVVAAAPASSAKEKPQEKEATAPLPKLEAPGPDPIPVIPKTVPPVKHVEVQQPVKSRIMEEQTETKQCPFSTFGDYMKRDNWDPRVADLVYWKDPKKSGIAFGIGLVILLSLACCSVISVVSYTALAILVGTVGFRIYKSILQAIQKTNDGHPFKEYLELEVTLPNERVHQIVDIGLKHVNATILKLRSVFLAEDLIDSMKFVAIFWCLTYIGSWFNGLTLIILTYLAAFSLPKVYEMHQAQIDQVLQMACKHVSETVNMVKSKIPFPAQKDKKQ